MNSEEETGSARPTFGIWLALICAWLLLLALQNALIVRLTRAAVGAYGAGFLEGRVAMELSLSALAMLLALSSVVLLAYVRRHWVLWLAVASLINCQPLLLILRRYVIGPFGSPDDIADWPGLVGLSMFLTLASAAYLLASERVRRRKALEPENFHRGIASPARAARSLTQGF